MKEETKPWSMREAYIKEHGPVPPCSRCHRRAVSNECMESMCPAPYIPPPKEPMRTEEGITQPITLRFQCATCQAVLKVTTVARIWCGKAHVTGVEAPRCGRCSPR